MKFVSSSGANETQNYSVQVPTRFATVSSPTIHARREHAYVRPCRKRNDMHNRILRAQHLPVQSCNSSLRAFYSNVKNRSTYC